MAEIVTNNTDRQILIHLHTSGATAPGVELLNEGELAVSTNISGASIYTLQNTEDGGNKVVKFITEDAISEKFADKTHEHLSSEVKLSRDLSYDGVMIAEEGSDVSEALDAVVEKIVENEETTATALAALQRAAKALKLNAVGDDSISAWTETTTDGTTLHVTGSEKLNYLVTNADTVVIGLEEGKESGVKLEDGKLGFDSMILNCGEF